MVYLVITKLSLTDECDGNVFNTIINGAKDVNFSVTLVPLHVEFCCISLMKPQFVIIHTIRQTEIPKLLEGWVTNTCQNAVSTKKLLFPYIFVKT